MVTVYGLLSSPVPDQVQAPVLLFWVTVPDEAVSVTASSKSEKVPEFVAAALSAALTEPATAPKAGGLSSTVRVVAADVTTLPWPSSTCTETLKVAGPSLMPRARSCCQFKVGLTPAASLKFPSPLTSQKYVS